MQKNDKTFVEGSKYFIWHEESCFFSCNKEISHITILNRIQFCTGKVKFDSVTCLKAHRVVEVNLHLFLSSRRQMGWMVSASRPSNFNSLERDPVPIVQKAVWGSGPVCGGEGEDAQNLALTGVRTRNDTARSESLYRLRYSSLEFVTHRHKMVP